ncbi:LuxR family transcriptional regulator [Sulfitobacter sp. TB366]
MVTPLSDRYLLLKEQRPDIKPAEMLQVLAQDMGLNNLSYLGFHKTGASGSDPVIHSTYDPAWLKRYQEENYHLIDPAVDKSLEGTLPVDWSELPKVDRTTRNFFGEAMEFGVRQNGVSIPIRDHAHGKAVLTLNSDLRIHEWRKYKRGIIADAIYLGCLIQSDMVADIAPAAPGPRLSNREKEVLKWAAVGKTAWETAQIMTVAASTVNHHLYNAYAKLDVTNKTHAVAKAIRAQIITI